MNLYKFTKAWENNWAMGTLLWNKRSPKNQMSNKRAQAKYNFLCDIQQTWQYLNLDCEDRCMPILTELKSHYKYTCIIALNCLRFYYCFARWVGSKVTTHHFTYKISTIYCIDLFFGEPYSIYSKGLLLM